MTAALSIAIVGAGAIGTKHAEAVRACPGLILGAIVGPNPDTRAVADRFRTDYLADLDLALASGRFDGIVLATPNRLHVPQALACVAGGVPVLVEKPVAVSVAEAGTLVAASEARGVPVLVGHHRRHNPVIREARGIIDSGLLGEIRAVQAQCWFYKPDRYFHEAPWRTEAGAGPVLTNAIHDIDLIRYLCGEIAEIQTLRVPSRRGHDNEDLAAGLIRFADGAVGTISVSDAIAAPWSWEMTSGESPAYPRTQESCYRIGGSLGSLSVPDLRIWRHEGGVDWWAPIGAMNTPFPQSDPLVNQMRHFGEVIAGRAAPLVSAREGMATLRVVERMLAG